MSAFISTMNDWAVAWGMAMFRASWIGGLAIALVWAITASLPRMPLLAHNWLWRFAYLKLFLLLFWNTSIELPLLSSARENAVALAPPIRTATSQMGVGLAAQNHAPIAERGISLPEGTYVAEAPTLIYWLFALWLSGALAYAASIARNWRKMNKFRAACRPLTDSSLIALNAELCRQIGKRRGPSLLTTNAAASPQLMGVLRPCIVLPNSLLKGCDRSAARMTLAHELAHWKRHDLAWNWLPAAANVLFYFHPAAWLAQRRWRLAQELSCDAAAMKLTNSRPDEYGRLLLEIVRICRVSMTPSLLSIGVSESFQALHQRMIAIRSRRRSSKYGRVCVGALLLISVGIALVPWRVTARDVAAAEAGTKDIDPAKKTSVSASSHDQLELPSILPERIFITVTLRKSKDEGSASADYNRIIAVDPNTGKFETLSEHGNNVRVSPDGASLAYSNDKEIRIWDFKQGNKPRRLIDVVGGGRPVWSGDGREIVVTDQVLNHKDEKSKTVKPIWSDETWKLRIEGSKKAWLPVPSSDTVEDWSSDGKWFVTSSDRHEPFGSGYQLYLISPDGTQQRRLTHGRGLNVYVRFSPDGKRIVFLHQERGVNSIRTIDIADGKESIVLTDDGLDGVHMACWSPDGQRLAVIRVTWQTGPDGKKYLSADEANHRLEIVSLDGKIRRPLKVEGASWFMSYPDWK